MTWYWKCWDWEPTKRLHSADTDKWGVWAVPEGATGKVGRQMCSLSSVTLQWWERRVIHPVVWAATPCPCFVVPGTHQAAQELSYCFEYVHVFSSLWQACAHRLHKYCQGPQASLFPAFLGFFLPIHGTTGVTNTEIRWTMKERLHSSRLVACEMKKKTLFLSLVISHNTPTECINHYKTIELRMIFIYCWQLECGWKEIVLIIWGKSQNWELNRMRFENSETISTKKGLHFFLLSGGGRKDKYN